MQLAADPTDPAHANGTEWLGGHGLLVNKILQRFSNLRLMTWILGENIISSDVDD